MELCAFLLYFRSPLHISPRPTGQLTETEGFIHSDTLASAIAWALVAIGYLEDDSERVKAFLEDLPLSSAFPFVKYKEQLYYFLPKPQSVLPEENGAISFKTLKKLQWIALEPWQRWIQEGDLSVDEQLIQGRYYGVSAQAVLLSQCFRKEDHMRVQLARATYRDPELFHSELLHFGEGCGLFFLAPKNQKDAIESALEVLQDNGLGSDRTVGYGTFNYETRNLSLSFPSSDYVMNLGVFLPETKETLNNLKPLQYQVLLRSGWITREGMLNLRRNSLYMFAEGSCFKLQTPQSQLFYQGAVRDVTPPNAKHPIYRSGNALFVPIKMKNHESFSI